MTADEEFEALLRGSPPAWAAEWGEDRYGVYAGFRVGEVVQRMRWVPSGSFLMGSPEGEEGRDGEEGAQRRVTLTAGFWCADTPVTQALWVAVTGSNPSHFEGEMWRPVEQVSWDDAAAFMTKLGTRVSGLAVGLPTEAQWEYACRAGTAEATHGPRDEVAWWKENSRRKTHRVAGLVPNPWGLYDMLGNVWEWTADASPSEGPTPYAELDDVDPFMTTGPKRVVRGGSWFFGARFVRAACRSWLVRDNRDDDLGFRLVRGQHCGSPDSERCESRDESLASKGGKAREGDPTSGRPASSPIVVAGRSRRDEILESARAWADDVGEDSYGRWASFGVGEAVQRMRWIRPGRFVMGSPEDEPGRRENEGPQHEVVLTQGYWMADTPCTQALWRAVMGDNPSRFVSPRRPVEQVSWEDVQRFLDTLHGERPVLKLRLPTEAQWEYACRAGTTTATYAGAMEILGENNAPVLDAIAWYGGNCGVDFDLETGADSSGWPEKQHAHELAGTREVGLKAANEWGLHDMLGNVWEWCGDRNGPYQSDTVEDPTGPATGPERVVRGGSWDDLARYVRAAYRLWYHPGLRNGYLGFRLVRGQHCGSPDNERSENEQG